MNQFQQQQNQIQQNMQIGSGLTRYRSAPSSYFDTFLTGGDDDLEHLLNHRVCSPETQRIFARFMSGGDTAVQENCAAPNLRPPQSWLPPPGKDGGDEPEVKKPRQQLGPQQSHDFSSVSRDIKSSFDGLLGGSIEANRAAAAQVKTESHSLVRHSSSPAGLFDSINIEEFGAMRGIGNFGAGNNANAEGSFSSASRFKSSQMDLPPRNPSSSAKMGPVSGLGNKRIGENRPADGQFNEYNDASDFPVNQWDDSILSDDFFKGLVEDDIKPFPKADASDDQKNEGGNRTTTRLSHHLSLPKSCSAMEQLFQDSVPCKLRAKRGFATHPRSIAERVRRTKISERIRKLQELVPNMDKQTNTADMLDLAVDYIKDLQRQVKLLSDTGAKCGRCAIEKS